MPKKPSKKISKKEESEDEYDVEDDVDIEDVEELDDEEFNDEEEDSDEENDELLIDPDTDVNGCAIDDAIAEEEFKRNMIPFKIKRPLPNGKYEIWTLDELKKDHLLSKFE